MREVFNDELLDHEATPCPRIGTIAATQPMEESLLVAVSVFVGIFAVTVLSFGMLYL